MGVEQVQQEIRPGVHRLGTTLVNWYLVEDEGRLTIVDAGLASYRPQLDTALAALRRSREDVSALILTHAHLDHVGFAEKLRSEHGVPVHVHEADEQLALTAKRPKTERSFLPYLRHGAARQLMGHFARAGLKQQPIGEVSTFSDGDVLDVPGNPRAILAPGHTNGVCAFHFERHGTLILGDVLVAWNPLTGRPGPQIPPSPFNVSSQQALDSLSRVEGIEAEVLLFGHGEPWTDGAAAAVAQAREAGPS
jgi:glyoxylase-like metal-dependent hydrolase (beta-lactamase superfamily II)